MKKNTSEAKKYLAKAISSLSQDFALKKARYYTSQAINEIQKVENKRAKREITANFQKDVDAKKQDMHNVGIFDSHMMWQIANPEVANKIISNLEKMIKTEKANLEKKKQSAENLENLFG